MSENYIPLERAVEIVREAITQKQQELLDSLTDFRRNATELIGIYGLVGRDFRNINSMFVVLDNLQERVQMETDKEKGLYVSRP